MLGTLSEDARRLAGAASVARHGLDEGFLLALSDGGKGPALINELVDGNALVMSGDGRYALTGGLREYFAGKMMPETRRKAHERAAKHLAQRAAGREPGWIAQLEEATRHAVEAEKPHSALRYAELAAEELSRLGEHRRALALCEMAAGSARKVNDAKQTARWQVAQAAALRHLGKQADAEHLCREALAARKHLTEEVAARAYHVLAGIALDRYDFAAGREYCREALAQHLSLAAKGSEASRLASEADVAARGGDAETAYALYRRSFAAAEHGAAQGEQPAELARRHFDFGLVEKYDHNLAAALAHFDEALRYADRAGGPGQLAVILGQLAEVRGRLGHFDYALALADSSLAVREGMSDPVGVQITLGIRMDIFLEAGDAACAREALARVEEAVGHSLDPVAVAFLNKRRGLLALLEGREEEGVALVEKALEAFRLLGKRHWVADCEETLARLRARGARQMRLPLEE
jgi:plasmid stabilization system protein ParE